MIMTKRKWVYLMQPVAFDIAPCSCGNRDTEWSEYEKHIWCSKCKKDFIPEHNGMFDGPIPINTATLLKIKFDRYNLETKEVERFNTATATYGPDKK